MAKAKAYKNLITGEWVQSSSGNTFDSHNPADQRELVGSFQDSTSVDVEQAVAAACEAYSQWRLTPAPERGEILFRVGEILTRRKEEIAYDMTREMGKIFLETRGDVQ